MPAASHTPARHLRADATRNRARVLSAAREAFAELGVDAPLDEIARRAGLGPGTVHRHFPTKKSLYAAALLANHAEISARAAELAAERAPGDAFFAFFAETAERGMLNRGLADALSRPGVDLATIGETAGERFMDAIELLVRGAQAAGAVRQDVEPRDVKALLVGVIAAASSMGLDAEARTRLATVAADGLRPPRDC
jgi:AcrR family transcriptional regulator